MRRLLLILALFVALPNLASAQTRDGRLIERQVFCPTLNETRRVQIYLPGGYDAPENSARRYPVVIFLHGFGASPGSYSAQDLVLDSLVRAGQVQPMILVRPDGGLPLPLFGVGPSRRYVGSFYTNSELNGRFENYITDDIVTLADTAYRTIPGRAGHGIAGHSMGGYGALKIAFKHPAQFAAVVGHSGPVSLDLTPNLIPELQRESAGRPLSFFNGIVSAFTFALSGAFSPDLTKTPDPVDLPVDAAFQPVPSVLARWATEDVKQLALTAPGLGALRIYFDVGDHDEYKLTVQNDSLDAALTRRGIVHRYEVYSGGHSDQITTRAEPELRFLDAAFRQTTTVASRDAAPVGFRLLSAAPNPFNPTTTIRYQLSTASPVKLEAFDALGRQVRTLVDETQAAGTHTATLDADGLATGVYLVRLTVAGRSMAQRVTLVR